MTNINSKIKEILINIIADFQKEEIISQELNLAELNFILAEPNIQKDDQTKYNYATNIAMVVKRFSTKNPMELAELIQQKLILNELIECVDLAKPGFINIVLSNKAFLSILNNVLDSKINYGSNLFENNDKYIVEFVSANPTGFLHVGHARGAIIGDTLVRILRHVGFDVIAEYYVNDAGNQINVLIESTKVRYFNLFDIDMQMPEDCYRGLDIVWLASEIKKEYGDEFLLDFELKIKKFREICISKLLDKIREHLRELNVSFDVFTSEFDDIYNKNKITPIFDKLKNHIYEKDGATFLKTSEFGDDKDRVLVKSDGSYTYFTPDIAYHNDKLSRANKLINVWGADHSGYINRMEIALECLGYNKEDMDILVVQLVRLIKDGNEFKMSKRAGTSVTLADLLEASSTDAIRFTMLTRDANTKFDFDIDKANQKDINNPVFGVQYAHSRACSLIKKYVPNSTEAINGDFDEKTKKLIIQLDILPDVLRSVAQTKKVQLLSSYVINLASAFNSFYSNTKILGSESEASLMIVVKAVKEVLHNTLELLGVSAPEQM
ncbi:arginine--tRNA ligase [Mycoplasmopsis anatis]|uniref:arginine--tRNA ligase n=1 Tax=Mycoplasmopsis anatis TaxID=171279 RepID=UPI001C4E2290|nr:arginine--tRNA ligase [Mycoplasmopsis anatis]MBW0594651.1 arginine--tRNA ligase [Mycoplasmopsis anatis]MBW0595404.1 arginine--tRNA ligase [Mycoplasmopsis anatis]MBW0596083.1 arginine--tRNA ligase [Mycoplasmopsis anatis]MBW0596924.1 arginine--tRNA ligase [Mycoplasmopsis anatis]MBW0597521.1 arginine--tRNA ligase [Mycoplasmopsis anatis]